jgi:hypothetical protein
MISIAGYEPTIPASQRPQTHALDPAATGFGSNDICWVRKKRIHERDYGQWKSNSTATAAHGSRLTHNLNIITFNRTATVPVFTFSSLNDLTQHAMKLRFDTVHIQWQTYVCVCNVFITSHLSPTCLNRRRDHLQSNLQELVHKTCKWTNMCYQKKS